jgi:hypothetical protein
MQARQLVLDQLARDTVNGSDMRTVDAVLAAHAQKQV